MEFANDETVRELRFFFDKGLKYLAISTNKQETEWGVKTEEMEPYILSLRVDDDADKNRFFGPLRFGFSLNGNKFGALNFVVY